MIADIRSAIAAAIREGCEIRASDLVVDNVNPPQAVVFRDSVDYSQDFDGGTAYVFRVIVYANRIGERSGQILLDELTEPSGDRSLKEAVEENEALKDLVDWVTVVGASATQSTLVGETAYLTTTWTVAVAA